MFKRLYKEANDSIPANDELLRKLLAEAEKPAAAASKNRYIGVIKLAYAAAAVFVISTAAVSYPNYFKKDNETVLPADTVITEKNADEKVGTAENDGGVQSNALPSADADDKSKATQKESMQKNAEKSSAEAQTPKETPAVQAAESRLEAAEKNTAAEQAESLAAAENTAEYAGEITQQTEQDGARAYDMSDGIQILSDTEEPVSEAAPAAAAVSGGGRAAAARMRAEEWTYADYMSYIGEEVLAAVAIPEGFEQTEGETYRMELDGNGAPTTGEWYFRFEKSEETIEITTAPQLAEVEYYLSNAEYDAYKTAGGDVVLNEDSTVRIYARRNKVDFLIEGCNLSDEEVTEVIPR